MLFRLYNILVFWQVYIKKILNNLINNIYVVFLNEILIYSNTNKEIWE